MRFAQSLPGKAILVAAVALISLPVSYLFWHASLPACTPSQVDGHCGLTTFLAVLYSLATSLACTLAAILYFVVQYFRVRAKADSN